MCVPACAVPRASHAPGTAVECRVRAADLGGGDGVQRAARGWREGRRGPRALDGRARRRRRLLGRVHGQGRGRCRAGEAARDFGRAD